MYQTIIDIPFETAPKTIFIIEKILRELDWDIQEINQEGIYAQIQKNGKTDEVYIVIGKEETLVQSNFDTLIFKHDTNEKEFTNHLKDLVILEHTQVSTASDIKSTQDFYQKLQSTWSFDIINHLKFLNKKILNPTIWDVVKFDWKYWATPSIILINIVVMLLMMMNATSPFNPDVPSLIKFGGNYKILTVNGEWWRLITYQFVHYGIIHLFFNIIFLTIIAKLLEKVLGSWMFLFIYICSGIFGGLVSLYFQDYLVSVGASGSIYGMYGIFFIFMVTGVLHKNITKKYLIWLSLYIILEVLSSFYSSDIDSFAHLGGFSFGIIAGIISMSYINDFQNQLKRNMVIIGILLLTISSTIIYVSGAQSKLYDLDKQIQRFIRLEEEVNKVEYFRGNYTQYDASKVIDQELLPRWAELNLLVDSMIQPDIPEQMKYNISILKSYIKVKQELLQMGKTYQDNVNNEKYLNQYEAKLNQYNNLENQIQAIIN